MIFSFLWEKRNRRAVSIPSPPSKTQKTMDQNDIKSGEKVADHLERKQEEGKLKVKLDGWLDKLNHIVNQMELDGVTLTAVITEEKKIVGGTLRIHGKQGFLVRPMSDEERRAKAALIAEREK